MNVDIICPHVRAPAIAFGSIPTTLSAKPLMAVPRADKSTLSKPACEVPFHSIVKNPEIPPSDLGHGKLSKSTIACVELKALVMSSTEISANSVLRVAASPPIEVSMLERSSKLVTPSIPAINSLSKPPSVGHGKFIISIIPLAAISALVMLVLVVFFVDSTNDATPDPRIPRLSPKLPRSFSPTIFCQRPPVLGATSVNDLTTSAAFFAESASVSPKVIPETAVQNAAVPCPSVPKFEAKFPRSFTPVISCQIPPVLGAISTSVFITSAAEVAVGPSIVTPVKALQKSATPTPKSFKFELNLPIFFVPAILFQRPSSEGAIPTSVSIAVAEASTVGTSTVTPDISVQNPARAVPSFSTLVANEPKF